MLQYGSTSAAPSVPSRSRRPLQKLLRFIDLGSQVWASPAIGVVQHHQGAVVLPDPLLGELALAVSSNVSNMVPHNDRQDVERRGKAHLSCRISDASLRFILGSKPPL